MTDEQRAARGRRAAQEFQELEPAFEAVEKALWATLRECPIGQDAKILRLHMAVDNLSAVRAAIKSVVSEGMLAEHAIAVAGLTRAN